MPPKRKAAPRAASTAAEGDHQEVGSKIEDSPPTTTNGRPKRQSVKEPVYTSNTPQNPAENAKKFAKTSKAKPPSSSGHKRKPRATKNERLAAKAAAAKTEAAQSEVVHTEATKTESPKPTRGRAVSAKTTKESNKRKRADSPLPTPQPKKRGRPTKLEKETGQVSKSESTKSAPKTQITVQVPRIVPFRNIFGIHPHEPSPGSSGTTIVSTDPSDNDSSSSDDREETDNQFDAQDTQYWLMKAEPDTRIENGIDVAYPIDKLAAATEPEPWDGVRNFVARNHMRAMRKNDLAFFYHSNTSIPGIVGVMRIVEEHAVDESAFDTTHPYFDSKSSRDKPKWDCVKVEFVKKFNDIITLKELKSTPELADMQIAQKAYTRLSVQPVKPSEWKFLLQRANEPANLGMVEDDRNDGYEAETDGETEKVDGNESVGISDAEVSKHDSKAVNGVENMTVAGIEEEQTIND